MKTISSSQLVKYIDYILRFYLSFSLLIYAISKIANVQFGNNRNTYLQLKVSELSSQDLVWVFYSFSKSYEIIIGMIQLIGIVLLAVNKTKVLGILYLWPVFINILLIDIFYQVNALASIIYYSVLLTILTVINYKQIKRAIRALLYTPFSKNSFLLNFKNLVVVVLGVVVLVFFSLLF